MSRMCSQIMSMRAASRSFSPKRPKRFARNRSRARDWANIVVTPFSVTARVGILPREKSRAPVALWASGGRRCGAGGAGECELDQVGVLHNLFAGNRLGHALHARTELRALPRGSVDGEALVLKRLPRSVENQAAVLPEAAEVKVGESVSLWRARPQGKVPQLEIRALVLLPLHECSPLRQ